METLWNLWTGYSFQVRLNFFKIFFVRNNFETSGRTGLKLPDVLRLLLGKSGTHVSIGLVRNGATVIAKLVRSTTALAPMAHTVGTAPTVVII